MISQAARIGVAFVVIALVMLVPSSAAAAVRVWDGGSSVNDYWTTGANWLDFFGPGVAPPNDGTADIIMGGTVRLTPLVNVPYDIHSLTFNSSAGPFVILGAEELTIGDGGVTNNDTDIQSVIGLVNLSANQTWTAAAGRLQMNALNLNGFNLNLTGANQIDLISLLSGAGNLTIADAYTSTVTMVGGVNNTYTGLTDVQGGTLVLQQSNGGVGRVAVPGDLTIGDGGTVRLAANEQLAETAGNEVTVLAGGLLDVNTRTETVDTLTVNGNVSVATGGKLVANSATVSGAGASWTNGELYIGDMSNGSLDITAGGHVSSGDAYVGNMAGITGNVTVEDAGSGWFIVDDLYVGQAGIGLLNINNASIESNSGYIGNNAGSSGTVTVDEGGIWGFPTNSFTNGQAMLTVGNYGTGNLNLINGGRALLAVGTGSSQVSIGANLGAMGTVLVSGAGSMLVDSVGPLDGLLIGGGGTGTLTIDNGGFVNSRTANVGSVAGGTGTLTIDGPGSRLTNTEGVFVIRGTVAVMNGGLLTSGALMNVSALGTVTGNGVIVCDTLNNGGLVSPGASPGALSINGHYNQFAAGKLLIELASPSSSDKLQVANTAVLAGTLDIDLLDGFIPTVGQSFTLITADDIIGTFTTEVFPVVANLAFDVIYNTQSVVLAVVPLLPGDYNDNDIIDAADYTVWRDTLGSTANLAADGSGNGTIDTADYNFWRARFGNTAGSGSSIPQSEFCNPKSSAAVPEPLFLVQFMGIALLTLRTALHRCSRSA